MDGSRRVSTQQAGVPAPRNLLLGNDSDRLNVSAQIHTRGLPLKARVLFLTIFTGVCLATEKPVTPEEQQIVDQYCAVQRDQEASVKGASMEVEIQAALPKLKKQGRLHALRHISGLGRITYEKLRFDGDNTVKNQVIARYLAAEAEAQQKPSPALAITPENYKFKYKHEAEFNGRPAHIFQVTPRQKRQGLFQGELWIDASTYLRVRESGYLVKSPSFFLKKIAFVRTYEIRDGISVPLQVQSVVDTRLVGKAELTIAFSNFEIGDSKRVTGDVDGQ